MKNAFAPAFFLLLLASPFFSEERLSPEHRRWLEDVTPILTKAERETFLKLTSEEGRNRFIQFFWRQRDPLPDTSENEFYEEYMKRIRFADAQFGRETSKRGSQTERGYFYLLLGPPLERQIFTTSSQIVPLELWYYKGDVRFGLPPYFYLIFYQPQGLGEYRLYYPGMEGPERLVIPSYFRPTLSRTEAFGILKDVSAELANASLSYLPGERTFGVTTSSSATIIANAKSLAEKKFSDAYARSFLLFKDYVETDYSHDFIQNDFKVRVFKNFHQFFVHWTMEPKTVNFALHDDRYYARFELVLRMEDLEGRPVLEKVEEIPLEITPEQYEAHERRPFAFQDVLPVIPGSYRLFFLMKNKTARDFTSFQADILVPDPKKGPMMSPVLLCSRRERGGSPPGGLKAFAFEGTQYLVSAQNMFSSQDKLFLYGQVYNLQEIPEKNVLVEIFSSGAEAPATRLIKPLKDVLSPGGEGFEIGPIPLSELKPGYYKLQASVVDRNNGKILTETENFLIHQSLYTVHPWVYSKVHARFPNPEHLYLVATQHFMKGDYAQARESLEQALSMKEDPRSRTLLARALYGLGEFHESLSQAIPLYRASKSPEAAKIIAADYAALKDWSSGLAYLEDLLKQAAEVSVLNLAAECYMHLGQPERALPLLEKSLELDPRQPRVRELETQAKELIKR